MHPLWVGLPLVAALLTIAGLARLRPSPTEGDRCATIDGLRGYLAFAVFLHHGVIWHGFLRTGRWEAPPSAFFNHLGQSSVALFFMITAFLFVGRLLDATHRPVDWLRLYTSRVLRLTPLYLLAMVVLFTVCGILTDWTRQVPTKELLTAIRHWVFFSIGGFDNLNGVPYTATLTAGVTWSLPLEWMFYLLLPPLAWLMRRPVPGWLALLTFALAWGIWAHHKNPMMLWAFAGGGVVAWWVRRPAPPAWITGAPGSLLMMLCLVGAVLSAPGVYHWLPMALLTLAFGLIASGSALWGILTARLSRELGELAYGIYLLHGLLLFISLQFILSREQVAHFTPLAHWLWLTALSPVVVTTAWLAHHWVERPGMARVARCTAALRARLPRPQKA